MSRGWVRGLQPAALGLGGAGVLLSATGITLNLFLGGAAYAAVMTPMLMRQYSRSRWQAAGVFNAMIALVWLIAVIDRQVSTSQWLLLAAVLAAVIAAEVAAGELLESLGMNAAAAGAGVLLAAIVWATWPVWGSMHLPESGAPHVVPLHPVFAINGVVPHLGIWTEQHEPYQLTAFGQNVVYRLPVTVIPCVALHVALAGTCAGVSYGRRKRRSIT